MSELFHFPAARRGDPAVDAWLNAQESELGSIASHEATIAQLESYIHS